MVVILGSPGAVSRGKGKLMGENNQQRKKHFADFSVVLTFPHPTDCPRVSLDN